MESISEILDNAEEIVGVIENDVVVAGVRSLDGQSGDLTTKTINNESILGTGNISLATSAELTAESEAREQADNTLQTNINAKQDKLNSTQMQAVNSGIDSTLVAQITTNQADIITINSKIPAQATSTNKLADKDFVNSSIATNTANFVGTFDTIEELEAVPDPTTNDYGFVISTDSAGNTVYNRYKYTGTAWLFEYALNNSSFTAEQWSAINSGITSSLAEQITTNKNNIATLTTGKQDKLTSAQLEAVDSGITSAKVSKLDGIEAGAEVNVIETIKVNGTALTPDAQKAVDVAVPIVPDNFFTGTATITGEGTDFSLANLANTPAKDWRMKGDTFQQTYTGKNLWGGFTSTYSSAQGFQTTWLKDGSITITGPAIANGWSDITSSALTGNRYVSLPAGTYTFYFSSNATRAQIVSVRQDGTGETAPIDITSSSGEGSFTLNETRCIYPRIRVIENDSSLYANFMIVAGSTAGDYEPYTGSTPTQTVPSPNPDYPQDIQVVTGDQTVTVSDGGSNSQSYTIELGSIELCKIGNYQDYIWKDGSDWKLHKDFGKVTLNGQENWSRDTTSGGETRYFRLDIADLIALDASVLFPGYSNYYLPATGNAVYLRQVDYGVAVAGNTGRLRIRNKDIEATADFQTWLGTHNTTVYYALQTPTDTTITDAALIAELEALWNAKMYPGANNVTNAAVSPNLAGILTVEAFQNNWAGTINGMQEEIKRLETRVEDLEQ